MTFAEFILEHENDDLASLVLHRDRWPGIDVALAAECIAARRKLRYKVPEWYAEASLVCPVALSAEQCSSTATARYKAAVVLGAEEACRLPLEAIREEQRARPCSVKGPRSGHCSSESLRPALPTSLRIADLTGGLGVDCWQFSKVADAVLYNEMNPVLLEAAKANLSRLGCSNVEFSNLCIDAGSLPGLLDSFRPDVVFADPARRGASGRKVFLPEDCSPDVLALQDIVLSRGCRMLLKLSPMADISLMLRKFHNVGSVHIVETDGECKELLLMLEPGFEGEAKIVVACTGSISDFNDSFRFYQSEEKSATPIFISEAPAPGQILFEPGPALMKSGALNFLSARFGLRKLGPSAHYLCFGKERLEDETALRTLNDLGKFFSVEDAAPFGKQALRDFASHWPDADVTARALPLSSDELRMKLASLGRGRKKSPDGGAAGAEVVAGAGGAAGAGAGGVSGAAPAAATARHIFGIGSSIGRLLIAAIPHQVIPSAALPHNLHPCTLSGIEGQ